MRRRGWWPLAFAVTALSEPEPRPALRNSQTPAAGDTSGPVSSSPGVAVGNGQSDTRRPLSWDREDEAIAAGECPWHPALEFTDHAELLRHVVRHARVWEAEARHVERLRRSLVGQVREFTSDVAVMAASILGETS